MSLVHVQINACILAKFFWLPVSFMLFMSAHITAVHYITEQLLADVNTAMCYDSMVV